MRYIYVSLMLFLFAGLFCGCNEYTPQTTEEAAIKAALADGQKYFVEEFVEWQEWTVRTAEFRTVELETAHEKQYDGERHIWHVIIGTEDDSRSVHFVVTDDGKKVIGGWDSLEAIPKYSGDTDQSKLISVEEAMIYAILFQNVRGNKQGAWKHVEVRLEEFTKHDGYRMKGGYQRYDWYWVPIGKPVWKIGFYDHEKDSGSMRLHDTTVFVRASNGKVYGYVLSGTI